MTQVLIAHAGDDPRADLVAAKLTALGYAVNGDLDADSAMSPFGRRKLVAEVDKAGAVLVLWSRDAVGLPALLTAANRAKALGKLTVVRLDTAAPPSVLKPASIDLSAWMGRDTRPWRNLVATLKPAAPGGKAAPRKATAAAPARPSATREKKKGGALGWVLTLFVLLAAAGGGAYYAYTQGMIPGL